MKFNVSITTHNDRRHGWAYGPKGAQRPHEAYQAILAAVVASGDWYPLAIGADHLTNAAGDTVERPKRVALMRISEIEAIEVGPYDPAVHG